MEELTAVLPLLSQRSSKQHLCNSSDTINPASALAIAAVAQEAEVSFLRQLPTYYTMQCGTFLVYDNIAVRCGAVQCGSIISALPLMVRRGAFFEF